MGRHDDTQESEHGLIRVVVCDDADDVRFLIAGALDRDDAFDVVAEARDGAEAIEAVGRTHPDCVVMDLRMPGCGGVEAVRRLREQRSDLAIVVLTGEVADGPLDQSAEHGADAVLFKTDTFTRLAPVIVRAVRGRRVTALAHR